ncbi:MAG: TIM-barrel domain-containing protein [Motilibacteraceae bacterium]
MKQHLRLDARPVAEPGNVVQGEHFRITVLADGLLRLEHSADGGFEDRPSQLALHRDLPPVEFELEERAGRIELRTARLHLVYDRGEFTAHGLSVQARGNISSYHSVWHHGEALDNLGGTARTLDGADGRLPLEDGVLSRNGIAVVDDSTSLLLEPDGTLSPRRPGRTDLYLFCYGRDYRQALAALYALSGKQPLLPRFALGNWWSRYHPYSADEYLALMDRFSGEGLPFSVGVIDMDWHLTDVPLEHGSGWTGYTWNRELFPDPPSFLAALHDRGLQVALNVHPADGIRAYEDAYASMALAMGIDPESGRPVRFEPADPDFLEAYLEEVHHPHERDGVDFWWLDWQSGTHSSVPGLDPLWVLNHVHYLDSARDGSRPLTFSRYAGVGSHRYPVGFSGDSVSSWASLAFQPEFTATASNVGYGWWSHDIGGHWFGHKDDELTARWVQLGVFSPVLRLHSTRDVFNSKEPWRFASPAREVMGDFLLLRHRLIPYLYTMNVRAHEQDEPLVQPMYYDAPWEEQAYAVPNQFRFGSELVVAPITEPLDEVTQLARARAWLPPGTWTDFFTGTVYRGGRSAYLHRGLDSLPVLARAGAVVPLAADETIGNDTGNPAALELRVFAGADGEFVLREDRDDERWASTRIAFDAGSGQVVVEPVQGERSSVPEQRSWSFVLVGFAAVEPAEVLVDDVRCGVDVREGPVPGSVRVAVSDVPVTSRILVSLRGDLSPAANDVEARLFELLDRSHADFAVKNAVYDVVRGCHDPRDALLPLQALDLPPLLLSAVTEVLLAS